MPISVAPVRHVSPQIAAALLSEPRCLLSPRQTQTLDVLKQRCPDFMTMRRLVLSFRTILRVGKVATLHRWLARADATNIHALQRFVRTVRQDLNAVEGAVTEPWSNGPVEGQINRLKMLRRQMYGRAGLDLLRARLLPLPPLAFRYRPIDAWPVGFRVSCRRTADVDEQGQDIGFSLVLTFRRQQLVKSGRIPGSRPHD